MLAGGIRLPVAVIAASVTGKIAPEGNRPFCGWRTQPWRACRAGIFGTGWNLSPRVFERQRPRQCL